MFWIEVAQLVLDVDAVLARKIHQLLGVDVQFARQGIDSDFLSILVQAAELLSRQRPRSRDPAGSKAASSVPSILTAPCFLKRDSFVSRQKLPSV
jgi:hypothetical protein